MKLTKNQLAGLQEVARSPIGSAAICVAAAGPLSGTTQNSLRNLGFVRILDDGRHRWVTITERGESFLRLMPGEQFLVGTLVVVR